MISDLETMSQMNDEINQAKNKHKREKSKTFVETCDHKSAPSKLWRTIKTLDGKSTQTAENEAITFNGSQVSTPKQIANRFNEQFTTSKLGRHNSSRETRLVSREVRRSPKETTVTFTTDMVTRAIGSYSNTKTFGPDKLSIFHLKHFPEPLRTSLHYFMERILHRHIISAHLTHLPCCENFGSTYTIHSQRSLTPRRRPTWVPTWTLNHLCTTTTYHRHHNWIQSKEATPSDGLRRCRPYCTVSHNVLISKITRSTLPEVVCQWLSCYLRGRPAVTSCREVKSSIRIVHTGVPQCSELSPPLFSFHLANMPRPTYPVN